MAPFNTHFLVAEKIWPELPGPWRPHYGQFCFGCVATDVDKASTTLTQKDTHFFDRTGDYELMASHRSATFIKRQADFLCRPFDQLPAEARAFVLGYLCHLCVDEVSKLMWRRDTWLQFRGITPGSAFAALDEAVWRRVEDYPQITEALCSITALDVIPKIPLADLQRMHRGACTFVRAKSVEAEYLALVDLFDRPTLDERRQKQQRFRAEIDQARRQIHIFKIDSLLKASLTHSLQRLTDLIEGRVPEPGYPVVER